MLFKYKKIFGLTIAALIISASINVATAQDRYKYKPKAGSFAMELGFAPLSNAPIQTLGGLVGSYYFSGGDMAVRIGLGGGFNNSSSSNGETGTASTSSSASAITLSLTPGIVKYFYGTTNLAPYIGGELRVATQITKNTTNNGTTETTVTHPAGSGDRLSLGAGAFAGFNYYFAKNLYLGAEISLGAASITTPNTDSTAPGFTRSKSKSSQLNVTIGASSLIRLGWVL